ncbi:hypothetical protein IAE35_13930 [Pseudomonas sp. S75]|uniref:hypothetical protein n=1 Tax=unclassified Pseudomonas TaxID=196821 RepID=UPI00190652B9|nr:MULTISPECIES: hypothetical protein [unclassified Pseudomonas]MBJ9976628.1 hypothetical protein [Pseudomonas sp. S30]MBK0154444.1 hypothetical protein [Pseudomonas sp. S75]
MLNTRETITFMRRYGACVLLAHLLALGALTLALVRAAPSTWRGHEQTLQIAFGATLIGALLVGIALRLVTRGHRWGVGLNVLVLLACLFTSLAGAGRAEQPVVFSLSVLVPLAGLLILNTRRHRQALKRYAVFRRDRARWALAMAIAAQKGIDLDQHIARVLNDTARS